MRLVSLVVVLNFVGAASAAAQSNVEQTAGVQFDFTPGARSLAMGRAFVATADDGSAAFVNPAGLRSVSRMEISVEGRGRYFTVPVIERGRLGAISNLRFDTIAGLVEVGQEQDAGGLSYLSFVFPRGRWALAGYRHEIANFESTLQTSGPFFGDFNRPSQFRRLPSRATSDLNLTSYGVSASFNVTTALTVGAGLAVYDFNLDARSDRFALPSNIPSFYDPPNFAASNLANFQVEEGDDRDIGFNAGALFTPSRMLQVGAMFRQGPAFDVRVTNNDARTNQPFPGFDRNGQFNVPHVFGVGLSLRPASHATVAVDVMHVGYSRLTDGFLDIFNEEGSVEDESGFYSASDATEIHAGFEYVITPRFPVALRAGYWWDPEHAIVYSGDSDSESAVFRRREDQNHFTFGGGVVLGTFAIDVGADLSPRANTFSFSGGVRF